jgi:parvulin-like peptidyl-prolyl cis-trans isomerase-like protein
MNLSNFIRRGGVLLLIGVLFAGPGSLLRAQEPAGGSATAKTSQPSIKADAETDPVVVSFNDQKITATEFRQILLHLPVQQRRQYTGPGGPRAFAEYLAQLLVLSQGAEKENLDRNPGVAARLKFARTQVLALAEQQAISDRLWVSDEDVRKYYDQNQNRFVQLHLLHISLRLTGSDAQEDDRMRKGLEVVRQRALKGEDFRALARKFSKDSDAQQGGDLGFLGRGNLSDAMDSIVFRLKPGEISEVFDAPASIHLFKALEERPQPVSEARPVIAESLRNRMLQAALSGLMHEVQPSVNEQYLARESERLSGEIPITVQVGKEGKLLSNTLSTAPPPSAKEKKK